MHLSFASALRVALFFICLLYKQCRYEKMGLVNPMTTTSQLKPKAKDESFFALLYHPPISQVNKSQLVNCTHQKQAPCPSSTQHHTVSVYITSPQDILCMAHCIQACCHLPIFPACKQCYSLSVLYK